MTDDERPTTAGPLQGLFWLNSKFVGRQAEVLDKRLEKDAGAGAASRIDRAYKLLYGRPPVPEEVTLGLEFISSGENAWTKYLRTLMGAAEFSSVN